LWDCGRLIGDENEREGMLRVKIFEAALAWPGILSVVKTSDVFLEVCISA
jgi:hypothetical protein